MAQNVTMKAKDTVFAALAECFVTIGTRRYNFMQAINLEAKFENRKGKQSVRMEGNWFCNLPL